MDQPTDSARDHSRRSIPATRIQALDRVAAILDALSDAGTQGMSLTALSAALGLNTSTVHTLLGSLTAHGLADQDRQTRCYRLGTRVTELNDRYLARTDLASLAAPLVHELWREVAETIHLSVLQGGRRMELTTLVAPQVLSVIPVNGSPSTNPVQHRTAAGKILVASMTDVDLEKYLRGSALASDRSSPAMNRAVKAEIEHVRRTGVAFNREEEAVGVCGVAAPIVDSNGAWLAALCIGYPAARSSPRRDEELTRAVKIYAGRLSTLIGGKPFDDGESAHDG
jgi:IclR family transcriptional regulator, acetate operon repressor